MRRTVFCLFLCLIACSAMGKRNEKKFERYIKEYDVTSLLQQSSGSPDTFWNLLENGHSGLNEYNKALAENKKLAVKADGDISMALNLINKQYNENLNVISDENVNAVANQVAVAVMGVNGDRIKIHFIRGNQPNAFCTPGGDIYIYSALADKLAGNWPMLYGVCAHEAAHYYMKHSARQKWADYKRQKKNRIIAGVAMGVTAGAMVATGVGMGNSHYYDMVDNVVDLCSDVLAVSTLYSNLYHFKYSREEELEADIIAYRFLEFVGVDPANYIRALETLGTESDAFYNKWSDHPTIAFRTEFLTYLGAHYPM